MATIVTRVGKGSPLTHEEVDGNFTNLNNDKLEAGSLTVSTNLPSGGGSLSYANSVFTFTPADVSGGSGLPLDASALSPNNGDILQFDATTNLWRAVTSANIGNGYSQLDTSNSDRFITASGNPFTVRNP